MGHRDNDTRVALIRLDVARARERAGLAARPSNNWIVMDRFKLEASADDAPVPMKEKPRLKRRVRKEKD